MTGLNILNRGEFILQTKKDFTVAEVEEMENALRNSKLYLLKLSADDNDLSGKLGLKVEYVTNMADDNEAELTPVDGGNYYGLIRLREELKKHKFAYIHEITHYIFDVGCDSKVDECFLRKKEGETSSHEGQRTNYMTIAYIISFEQIVRELYKHDHSVSEMDGIVFIRTLQGYCEQSEAAVIRRICGVRKLVRSSGCQSLFIKSRDASAIEQLPRFGLYPRRCLWAAGR